MQPLMRSAVERGIDDTLPFCVVSRISGPDDPEAGTDDPVVQLDFYADGPGAAKQAANDGHRRMMLLARESNDVTLSDDSVANCDFVETLLKPFRMAYEHDQIVRYTARYRVGLSYVAIA
ncbi:MAG: hypothetical protein K0U84_01645 [Actinomycetia bacterium]|nr:hypothetical protein [Actinomycetes bacterium]